MPRTSWNRIEPKAELRYDGKSKDGGIYQITNKINGRRYVGSTYRFDGRWKTHLRELRRNKHCNPFLQNDFNKCGEEAFVFEVIEVVGGEKKERQDREQYYLDKLFEATDKDTRYNLNQKATLAEGKRKLPEKKYREDRYWLKGPDGKEYVIEVLSKFCKEFNLTRAEIYKVISGKLLSYKGWTALKPELASNVLINTETGEEYAVLSPIQFARSYNLQQSHISKLLKGSRYTVGAWEVKGRVFYRKSVRGKEVHSIVKMTEPEKVIKFNNAEEFARKNGLNASSLRDLLGGKCFSYRGYMVYGMTLEKVRTGQNKRYEDRKKNYSFRDPDGNVVCFTGIKDFCRKHGLRSQAMIEVHNRRRRAYRGWIAYIEEETDNTLAV